MTEFPVLEMIIFRTYLLILHMSYCCLKLQINSKQVCGGDYLLILVNKDLGFLGVC